MSEFGNRCGRFIGVDVNSDVEVTVAVAAADVVVVVEGGVVIVIVGVVISVGVAAVEDVGVRPAGSVVKVEVAVVVVALEV